MIQAIGPVGRRHLFAIYQTIPLQKPHSEPSD